MANRVFLGGLPYAIDVKRLEEAFPVSALNEGKTIDHETLEKLLEVKRGTQRYYGIINSWIKRERNQNNVHLAWQPGEGLKVLNPAELLDEGDRKTLKGIRGTIRGISTYAWVDRNRLDDTGKQRLDHKITVAAKLRDNLISSRTQMAVDLAPVKCLPKPDLRRVGQK